MKTVRVLGDSHTMVFDYINKQQNDVLYKVCTVVGATAYGLGNPNSRTDSYNRFREALAADHNTDYLLVMLGEVDCGFVIWWKTRTGLSVLKQMNDSVRNLFNFVNNSCRKYYSPEQIIIAGPIIPLVHDCTKLTEKRFSTNLRQKITANIRQRTDLTLHFNVAVRDLCREHGFQYIDIVDELLDQNTKIIKDRYIRHRPIGIHLPFDLSWKLWQKALLSGQLISNPNTNN